MSLATAYESQKERSRTRQARVSALGRDIGAIPPVAEPARRMAAMRSFRVFCEEYQRGIYSLAWSADHLRVIEAIERAVSGGYLAAIAMPRGSGKTSLCESAGLWATLKGRIKYALLLGSDQEHALQNLHAIHSQLTTNGAIIADFPEVCYPLARLEGIHQRRLTYDGRPIRMEITRERLILPAIPGSPAASAIIQATGLTGGFRGMKYDRPDGTSVRPQFVMIDDPQTDESARSPSQCETRERILAGAVLGLAGPGQRIAGVMPCTVIRPGDMADNILDRQKHPEWHGNRTKMVYAFPSASDLWSKYAELRANGLRGGDFGRAATEFYSANRSAMDAGAVVAWESRFNRDELSAIQHAMNLRLQDERAFFAEYQNDPLPLEPTRPDLLTADQVAAKLNRLARGKLPVATTRLTAMIDVHQAAHYYTVAGWDEGFTGATVEYGTFPDQQVDYFGHLDIRRTLATVFPAAGPEAQVYAGLEALTDDILGREWVREDGAVLKVERCLIDANWGPMADVVYQFCRQSKHAALILPSHGRGIGASSRPISEYSKKPGDRFGLNWYIPASPGKRASRKVIFDANFWKTFIHSRLAVPMGDRGCLSLFGADASRHRMYAEHLTAEVPVAVRKDGTSRLVDEWKLIAGRDNHFLDTLVGAAVAASIEGVSLEETRQPSKPTRKPLSIDELKARYRAG